MIATQLTNRSLTVIVNNAEVFTINSDNPNWGKSLEALKANNESELIKWISVKNSVKNFSTGNITIENDRVFYKNKELHGVDVDRIIGFLSENLPAGPMIKFLEKKQQNPSFRAIEELYTFLQHKNLPITPDGNFLAYKGLKSDYYSVTAGKLTLLKGKVNNNGNIYNGIGEEIECERNEVDDKTENHCSKGLHAGSLEYATGFAQGKVVIVEINPADVVSVPNDCNCQKLRTCKYKVVGEYTGPLPSTYTNEFADDEAEDSDEDWGDAGEDLSCDDCGDPDCGCMKMSDYDVGYEKGVSDYNDGKSRHYTKIAKSDYGRGYSDGWEQSSNIDSYSFPTVTEAADEYAQYEKGREKGYSDYINGKPAKYSDAALSAYGEGYFDGWEAADKEEEQY